MFFIRHFWHHLYFEALKTNIEFIIYILIYPGKFNYEFISTIYDI
jgi:hypothetical protein